MNFSGHFELRRKGGYQANFGSATVGKCELEGGKSS